MAIQARHFRQWSAFLLLLALGGAAAWFLMPREWSQMQWEIPGTPSEYPLSQLLRPWLILLGCFLPALGMFLYNRSSILDKYVARTWFTAFIMCTAILTLIYIIGDFADNVGDLMNLDAPLMGTFRFYLSQLPMILNLILPYTLLLGTLWALTKLSSSSEITVFLLLPGPLLLPGFLHFPVLPALPYFLASPGPPASHLFLFLPGIVPGNVPSDSLKNLMHRARLSGRGKPQN